MAFTTIDKDTLRDVLIDIRDAEGEPPTLLKLELVLDNAVANESVVYVDAEDLEFLRVYLK